MGWDFKGNLAETKRTGNGYSTYYRYDSGGNRIRKVTLNGNIREERIYIGNYEVYRKTVNGTLDSERESSFVSDDTKRIAIIDTLTTSNPGEVTIRYQYDNHLGSACLELDSSGQVISYEEYHPFGTTSYRGGRNTTETALKRYKYVGKERDEETGLYYYGARYYAAWLCRFVSVDPLQFKYPHYTPYQYAGNKPISYIDLDGLEEGLPTLQYKTKASGTVDNRTPLKLADNIATGISRFGTGLINSTFIGIPNTIEYNINYIRENGIGQWASDTGKAWSGALTDLATDTKSFLQEPPENQWGALDDLLNSPVAYDFAVSLLMLKLPIRQDLSLPKPTLKIGSSSPIFESPKIGWNVGESITNLTYKGTIPKWSTVRQRFWKNEAYLNNELYLKEDLIRMRQGLAPQRLNPVGLKESMELHHHKIPQREGGLYKFIKVTPDEHKAIDVYRK
jgi:RHS repeat-associated protein